MCSRIFEPNGSPDQSQGNERIPIHFPFACLQSRSDNKGQIRDDQQRDQVQLNRQQNEIEDEPVDGHHDLEV